MAELLLLGFEPFGGDERNPSGEIALRLGGEVLGGLRVRSAVLPVERAAVGPALLRALEGPEPAAVLATGVASGRAVVTVEALAVNLDDYAEPDNAGEQPRAERISKDGPDARFASLPPAPLVAAVRAAGVPAEPSTSAGTYLCNRALYLLLERAHATRAPWRAGFVHLPPLPESVAAACDARPSMALETSERAVRAALEAAARLVGAVRA